MPLDQVDVDMQEEEDQMTFFDHLESLRWHIIRSFIAIFIVAIFIFLNKDFVFNTVLYGPRHKDFFTYRFFCQFGDWICITPTSFQVITRDLGEKFATHIKVSFFAGLIVAFPYIFWEFWRFISPGLFPHERKSARGIVFVCSILFITGVLFGYFLIAPFAMSFLAGYELGDTLATPTLGSYVNYMIMFTLPIGMVFEMPVVSYFLAKIGLIGPGFMTAGRRYAIVIILIISGILTPSPDVFSQMILATPLYLLYELSILIVRREFNRNKKREAEDESRLIKQEQILEMRNKEMN